MKQFEDDILLTFDETADVSRTFLLSVIFNVDLSENNVASHTK